MGYAENFIKQVAPGAVEIQVKIGLPAAAIIAQACLETGFGRYMTKDVETGKSSLNLFNIKGVGPAGTVKVYTREMKNGRWVTVTAEFRAYNNFAESFDDYAAFILKSARYAKARKLKDPIAYLEELQKAGYATDPQYAGKCIGIIKKYNLLVLVAGMLPPQVKTHKVVKGETLSSIARKYNTTVKKIIEANKATLKDPNKIYPGQVLIIP